MSLSKNLSKISYRAITLLVVILFAGVFLSIFYSNTYIDSHLFSFNFLFGDVQNAGRKGGVGPVLFSTLIVVFIAIIPTVIISIISGHFLYGLQRKNPLLYKVLDVFTYILAAVPSVVMGLFGNVLFVHKLGLGFSLLSGGITLSFMILPLTIKVVERSFANIDIDIKTSAASLGLSERNTFFKVLLPCAKSGIISAIIIGVGRALSETAALLFTSGYVTRSPESVLDSGRVLSVHIFELVMNVPGGDLMAKKSVTILFVFVLLFNYFALKIMKGKSHESSF